MLTVTPAPATVDPAPGGWLVQPLPVGAGCGVHATGAAAAPALLAAFRDAGAGGAALLTRDDVTLVAVGDAPGLGVELAPASHDEVRCLLDRLTAGASRWSVHNGLLAELGDETIAVFAALATELATPAGHIVLEPLGDGHSAGTWAYRIAAGWSDPRADAAETAWSLAAAAELRS